MSSLSVSKKVMTQSKGEIRRINAQMSEIDAKYMSNNEEEEEDGSLELTRKLEREEDPDLLLAAPPCLERTQARQISRVGAIPVPGIGASAAYESNSLANHDEEEAVGRNSILYESNRNDLGPSSSPSTLGTCSSAGGDMEAGAQHATTAVDVTATPVTEEEYQAELHRVILRTAVRASKVETVREGGCAWAYFVSMCVLAILFFFGVVTAIVLTADAIKGSPPPREEEWIAFLKTRSFDAGEASKSYASPQRNAIRFIQSEFPNLQMDEKLIDVYAVTTFSFSTAGTWWTDKTKWKSGDPVCSWKGIGCDDNGYVISIELSGNNLGGNLPMELAMLAPRQVDDDGSRTTGLIKLDLSFNQIKGEIPKQIGLLTFMEEFSVEGNGFNGDIPPDISGWTNLRNASFAGNTLVGEIPEALCSSMSNTTVVKVDCKSVQCDCCTPVCSVLP